MTKITMIILEFLKFISTMFPIHDGMSSGQLFPERETLFKKPLPYIRWVTGDGYV